MESQPRVLENNKLLNAVGRALRPRKTKTKTKNQKPKNQKTPHRETKKTKNQKNQKTKNPPGPENPKNPKPGLQTERQSAVDSITRRSRYRQNITKTGPGAGLRFLRK